MNQKIGIILVIGAVVAIGTVIGLFYSADQTKLAGKSFGIELKRIQDELKITQERFESDYQIFREGGIMLPDFLGSGKLQIEKLEELLSRYDSLSPPPGFESSVELFKLSTESQIESYKQTIKWLEDNDEPARIRSNELLQEAFNYEMAALSEYNAAKAGVNP